jgi:isopentenyldiphosphate isomerase
MKEFAVPEKLPEFVDIVDESGEPTGQVVDKEMAHQLGLRHLDVHVFVTDRENYLEQLRKGDKDVMPSTWDISASGHVAAGELPVVAAVREMGEEVGIEATPDELHSLGRLPVEMDIPGWPHPHRTVSENFAHIVEPGTPVTRQPEEVDDTRWYPLDQFRDDIQDPERAELHAPQPRALYELGLQGMEQVIREREQD